MKTFNVNVQIQFDSFEAGKPDNIIAMETINRINEIIQHQMNDVSPHIFGNNIDDSDIEVVNLSSCCDAEIEGKMYDLDGTNLEEFPTCTECGEIVE